MGEDRPRLAAAGGVPALSRRLPRRAELAARRAAARQAGAKSSVGYGVVFGDAFRTRFVTGTRLQYEVVFPDRAGGDLADYLYLTAMNRAALGLEAYIWYWAQDEPMLGIFDWARPDGERDQKNLRVADLAGHVYEREVGGIRYRVMGILNTTVELGPDRWRNEAWLFMPATADYTSIYGFDYTASLDQQHYGKNGWWGPIVEVFPARLNGTGPMGFADAFAGHRDAAGNWSGWELLLPGDTKIRDDQVGCRLEHLDLNYSFIVTS